MNSALGLILQTQLAYRPFHRTETKVTTDKLSALECGDVFALTLPDLSAAFDTMDPSPLLHRLHTLCGIAHSRALSILRLSEKLIHPTLRTDTYLVRSAAGTVVWL